MLEKLSSDETAYHAKVHQAVTDAQAILKFWQSHLCQKYGLQHKDTVALDGTIHRVNSKPQESLKAPSHLS